MPKIGAKGVSPLIASVLLITFTMSVAMLAGPFFSQTVKDTQKGTTDQTQKLVTASNMRLEITNIKYNRTTSNLTVYVQNMGDREVENISLTIFGDQVYNREYSENISKKRIKGLEINAGDNWNLEKVEASLQNYPVSTEKGLDGRPMERSLVGYWPMDEGSGVWANDSVQDNNARLKNSTNICSGSGCPTWVKGKQTQGIELDGSYDRLQAPDDPRLDLNGHTIMFWMKMKENSSSNWDQILVKGDGGSRTPGLWFQNNQGNSIHWRLKNCNNNNDGIGSTDTGFQKGKWYHLIGTYNSEKEKLKVYVNGRLDSSVTVCSPLSTNNADFFIGDSPNYGSINMMMDEVRIWNTALSEDRIRNPVVLQP